MGWLGVLLGSVASLVFFREGSHLLLAASAAATLAALWSYRAIRHHAVRAARGRKFKGGFYDLDDRQADATPAWLVLINLKSTIIGAAFLLVAVF